MNIIYLRVSTNEDRQDLNQQKEAIIKKFNLEKYVVMMDEGSAFNQEKIDKRVDFLKLLDTCFNATDTPLKALYLPNFERKEHINLYVWDYSRIMRNIESNVLFYLMCSKAGITIHSCKDSTMINTDESQNTPTTRLMGILNYLLLSYSAEQYSLDISTNITRAFDGEGYSKYGIKLGTYKPLSNWQDYWSNTFTNNKGEVLKRLTDNGRLRLTKEEDSEFLETVHRLYVKHKGYYIPIVKEVASKYKIELKPDFLTRNMKNYKPIRKVA
jgi:DNA invertase Pin-like site-specific DNA recombinase